MGELRTAAAVSSSFGHRQRNEKIRLRRIFFVRVCPPTVNIVVQTARDWTCVNKSVSESPSFLGTRTRSFFRDNIASFSLILPIVADVDNGGIVTRPPLLSNGSYTTPGMLLFLGSDWIQFASNL